MQDCIGAAAMPIGGRGIAAFGCRKNRSIAV
jgi:hypothetical protein